MAEAKKYINEPISYSSEGKLLETRLFQEIARAHRIAKSAKKKSSLTALQKLLAEKRRK